MPKQVETFEMGLDVSTGLNYLQQRQMAATEDFHEITRTGCVSENLRILQSNRSNKLVAFTGMDCM